MKESRTEAAKKKRKKFRRKLNKIKLYSETKPRYCMKIQQKKIFEY